jgi:hypothetical protein
VGRLDTVFQTGRNRCRCMICCASFTLCWKPVIFSPSFVLSLNLIARRRTKVTLTLSFPALYTSLHLTYSNMSCPSTSPSPESFYYRIEGDKTFQVHTGCKRWNTCKHTKGESELPVVITRGGQVTDKCDHNLRKRWKNGKFMYQGTCANPSCSSVSQT